MPFQKPPKPSERTSSSNTVKYFPALSAATLLLCLVSFAKPVSAQCDDIAENCAYDLLPPFTSDGQFYRAELFPGESATLRITFYENMVYRMIPCSDNVRTNPVIFTLYDPKGNQLYTNQSTKDQLEWDFTFGATSTYTLSFKFANPNAKGCLAIVIGYKDFSDDPESLLDF